MTELSPAARALVDAARDGLAPDAAAIRRMRSNIATAVGGGAAAAGAGAGGAKLALAAKLAILAAITGTIVGAYVLSQRSSDEAIGAPHVSTPAEHPSTVTASSRTPKAADSTAVDPDAIEIDPPASVTPRTGSPATPTTASRATTPTPRATAAVPATVATQPAPPTAEAADKQQLPMADLAREVALVDRAMTALRDGDPNSALTAIHRYDLETRGKGQLAEDAAAIAVEALCLHDDPTATAKLQSFDARWPHSAQRARVRATCQR